jgi:hypothetical protein
LKTNAKTHPPRQAAGIALVIVISMIALLTAVTVSLMVIVDHSAQRSASEVAARQTEALAQAAFETLLADLGDEMEKASPKFTEHRLEDGSIYRKYDLQSAQRAAMVVSRSLTAGAPQAGALVKQSQSGSPFHAWSPDVPARASKVSTAAGASPFAPEAWERPRLLAATESFTAATVPTWIYLSRNGGNPPEFSNEIKQERAADGEPNQGFVIGRYAFSLYDTSGLLDINVAGFPSVGGPRGEMVGSKGTLAFADLTQLPEMSQSAVDGLSKWRHDWAGDAMEYIRLSEGFGWRKLASNGNVFLSRQDLLRFADVNPGLLPRQTLSFLTHFSRDLDAPSYRPDPKRQKIQRGALAGGNDAFGADDLVNPDLTAFDDKRKRPLLPRRFPLERLKWVATPDTSGPVDAEKAERYFGLRWQGTYWEYVHGRPNGDLFTLQDVPAEREPNFFELLRATVLTGSLGRQYASRGHDDIDQRVSMHRLGGVDASVNLNILEMGACLIDQYDSDSYPTAIMLPGPARPYFAFGKEDVPYLHRLSAIPYRGRPLPGVRVYRDDGTPAQSEAYEGSMVLQPMLWRPHQVAKDYRGPTNFRLRPQHVDVTGGGSMFYLTQGWTVPNKGPRPGVPARGQAGDYSYWDGPNYRTTHPELYPKTFTGSEYIDISVPHGSLAFREPQSVHSTAHGAVAGYTIGGNVEPVPVRNADLRWNGLPTSYDAVSGFLVGYAVTARIEPGASSWQRLGVGYFRGDPIEILMEYQGSDGSWLPYHRGEFTYKSNWGDHYLRPSPLWETEAFHWSSYLIDPRTPRFGGLSTVLAGGMKTTSWTSLHPQMTWPEASSLAFGRTRAEGVRPGWTGPSANTGWNWDGGIGWWEGWSQGGVAENNETAWAESGATFAYRDPDGVLRPGVAGFNEYGATAMGNPMSRRYRLSSTGALTQGDSLSGRPVILNRPFRSVGEMAYSFRGTPWRDIDFIHWTSPDAGMLDVFCLYEDPEEEELTAAEQAKLGQRVVAGRVNLNSAPLEVLGALLSGAHRDENAPLPAAEVTLMAKALFTHLRSPTSPAGPLLAKSDLVTRSFPGPSRTTENLVTQLSRQYRSAMDRSINDRREGVTRALSDGVTVRSWTFMMDLVVQSGRLPPAASSLEAFQSSGERRYWVHFSLDRVTGQLLDVQWERVEF